MFLAATSKFEVKVTKIISLSLIQFFLFSSLSFAGANSFSNTGHEKELLSPAIQINVLPFTQEFQAQPKNFYLFGRDLTGKLLTEGRASQVDLLGGKGANLHELTRDELKYEVDGKEYFIKVPPGSVATTKLCDKYYANGQKLLDEDIADVKAQIKQLEKMTGRKFGGDELPLLVSCRSGAKISMPGMMETVLNVGLNDQSVIAFAKELETLGVNPTAAYDCYRRLLKMYSNVVLELDAEEFENFYSQQKDLLKDGEELTIEQYETIVEQSKALVNEKTGSDFPQDVYEQVLRSLEAVFASRDHPRCLSYKRLNKIPLDLPTAATIEVMKLGNLNPNSATGVCFTRDPATGENVFYGEVLYFAQGEDVVSGEVTPMPINEMGKARFLAKHPEYIGREHELVSLEEAMPEQYKHLVAIYKKLELHYKNMQDMEFTIEDGELWMLQTRNGKRTAAAALNMAIDMVDEGLISEEEAVMRINDKDLDSFLHPLFDPKDKARAKREGLVIAVGLNASPGAASGELVFDKETALALKKQGKKSILGRTFTVADDIEGIDAADGTLTAKGGSTSHAAVVCRSMNKTAVVGCSALSFDVDNKKLWIEGEKDPMQGKIILSIDGYTGEVIQGEVATIESIIVRGKNGESLSREEQIFFDRFQRFEGWLDKYRPKGSVRVNAETRPELEVGLNQFNGDGVGLFRTEHQYFHDVTPKERRLHTLRKVLLSGNPEGLKQLEKIQKNDFVHLNKILKGRPATVRLFDFPAMEVLPDLESEDGLNAIDELAKDSELNMSKKQIIEKIESLQENNPMSGKRAIRFLIDFPEFLDGQIRAILGGYKEVKDEGLSPKPIEIMVPFVQIVEEFKFVVDRIVEIATEEFGLERGVDFTVGHMVETPSAAILADELSEISDFGSNGTNDQTQFTFWFSREDAGNIVIPAYSTEELPILPDNPFDVIDPVVGEIVGIGDALGKRDNPKFKTGLCGEHGGNLESNEDYIIPYGLNYASCSPLRVVIAKLAWAQNAIRAKRAGKKSSVEVYDLKKIETKPLELNRVKVQQVEEMMQTTQLRKNLVRTIILNANEESKQAAIEKLAAIIQPDLEKMLQADNQALISIFNQDLGGLFKSILESQKVVDEDTPLGKAEELMYLSLQLDRDANEIEREIKKLYEINPAKGNVGVRQILTGTDGIFKAQVTALISVLKKSRAYKPRLIVPTVAFAEEVEMVQKMVADMLVAEGLDADRIEVGASIRTVRAALKAGEIAKTAKFLVFNLKGLTESVIATTEADAQVFIKKYLELGIYKYDPFKVLSMKNVGKFMAIATRRALEVNPSIPIYAAGTMLLEEEVVELEDASKDVASEGKALTALNQAI